MRRTALSLAATCAIAALAPTTTGQVLSPPELPPIDWQQKLGSEVPLDATFTHHTGKATTLDDLLSDRPAILVLLYYECPMLCSLVLDGALEAMKDISLNAGEDFDLIAVSIDPDEGHELAAAKRKNYLAAYDREGADEGWHFLVGDEAAIRSVADSVGYVYTYLPEIDEYAHPAGIAILSAEGQVSRILFGHSYESRDVRLALVEASEGRVGSPIDAFLLRCFHYDPIRGKYGFAIMSVLRTAGILTVVSVAFVVLRFLLRERGLRTLKAEGTASA